MPASRLTLSWALFSSPCLQPPLGYGDRSFPISQALGGVADRSQSGDLPSSLLLAVRQVAPLCGPTSHHAVWVSGRTQWASGRNCGGRGRCSPRKNTNKRGSLSLVPACPCVESFKTWLQMGLACKSFRRRLPPSLFLKLHRRPEVTG